MRTTAAAAVTMVLWASAFVGIRAAGAHIGAGPLALGRLLIGCAALGALALGRREPLPGRRELPLICLCGLLWFGLYNVALNAAERRVDAGVAAMLVNVAPIFVALLAGLVLREGFPPPLLAGCAVAFAGVVVIGLATAPRGVALGLGPLLCLVAAAASAGGIVVQKVVLRSVSPLTTTFLCCAVGAASCLAFAPGLVRDVERAPLASVLWMVYLGVFPTSVAFTTWAYALARTDAGRLGATIYVVPAMSILLAWLVLAEVPAPLAFAGGALCVTGVVLSRLPRRERRAVTEEPATFEATP